MMEVIGFNENGTIAAIIDGKQRVVPDDMANRFRRMIAEWEAEGNTIPPYEPSPPTLADLKLYAADKRWRVETGGTVDPAGNPVATDDKTQNKLAATIKSIEDPDISISDPVNWKGADGNFYSLSLPQLKATASIIGQHVQASFDAEKAILAAIEAGEITTTEAIENDPRWP